MLEQSVSDQGNFLNCSSTANTSCTLVAERTRRIHSARSSSLSATTVTQIKLKSGFKQFLISVLLQSQQKPALDYAEVYSSNSLPRLKEAGLKGAVNPFMKAFLLP
jgi:hypothetical protein